MYVTRKNFLVVSGLLINLIIPSQTTNYAPAPITFQRMGEMSPDVSEYILLGKVEVNALLKELRQLQEATKWMKDTVEKLPKSQEKRLINRQLKILYFEVKDLNKHARSLETLVEEGRVTQNPRAKRAIGLILGGAAVIGAAIGSIAYSGYLGARIDAMEEQQASMLKYVDMTAALAESNERRITALNATLQLIAKHELQFEAAVEKELQRVELSQRLTLTLGICEEILSHITAAVSRLTAVWTSALQGKISLDLISPEMVKKALKEIEAEMPAGMQLAIDTADLTSFYRLPCHLISKEDGYVVAVPIPVYKSKDLFQIFKHINAPVATGEGLEMILDTDGSYLAINRERTLHAELTVSELQACLNVNELYLCPQRRVFRKAGEPSCLYQLFQGKTQEAQRTCTHAFRYAGKVDIVQLSRTTYVVIASQESTITMSCEDGQPSTDVTVKAGTQKIELSPGCSISTDNIYVVPAGNQTELGDIMTVDTGQQLPLNMEDLMKDLYPHLDLKVQEIKNITKTLTQVGATVTLKDVIAARQRLLIHHASVWHYGAMAGVIAIMVIAIILYCVVKKKCVKDKKPKMRVKEAGRESEGVRLSTLDASQILVNA